MPVGVTAPFGPITDTIPARVRVLMSTSRSSVTSRMFGEKVLTTAEVAVANCPPA